MSPLPDFLARRRQRQAQTPTCPRCGAPVIWTVVADTGEEAPLDPAEVPIWLFRDLEHAGAERGLEDHEQPRGYYVGDRIVPGLVARPGVLPGVPVVQGRRAHTAICTPAQERLRPDRVRTGVDDG